MFNIGGAELVMIGVIALLVVPTKDIPQFANKIGRFLAQLNHQFQDVKRSVQDSYTHHTQDIQNVHSDIKKTFSDVKILPPSNHDDQ